MTFDKLIKIDKIKQDSIKKFENRYFNFTTIDDQDEYSEKVLKFAV